VVDLWNARAKLRRVKILLMFHRYGVCWLCVQVERLGQRDGRGSQFAASPLRAIVLEWIVFAIKSLLNTRCCKFRYNYNSLPGNWLVKSLYLVQSVARTVQNAAGLGGVKTSGMFDLVRCWMCKYATQPNIPESFILQKHRWGNLQIPHSPWFILLLTYLIHLVHYL